MKTAYEEAFAAHHRCTELLREHQWTSFDETRNPFNRVMRITNEIPEGRRSKEDLYRMHADAQAEDLQADYQAFVATLFADDTLQRLANWVLGKAPGLSPGYGPAYGNGVKLTTLLGAGANDIRHVSEWDDGDLPFRYPELSTFSKISRWRQLMESITVIQKAFGIGILAKLLPFVQ